MGRKNLNFDCPWTIEDNVIKDHVGGTLRKEWLLKGSATLDGSGVATVTIASLSGNLVIEFDDYFILVQKVGSAPVIVPKADSKSSKQFRITGDAGATVSIIVLGYEKVGRKSGKWAYSYCEYCKAMNLKALVGSALPGLVVAGFPVTCSGGGTGDATFEVATQTTGSEVDPDTGKITYMQEGLNKKPYGLKKMKLADYSMFIAPVETPGTVAYPTAVAKNGFSITGGASKKYDVLVFGEIEQ